MLYERSPLCDLVRWFYFDVIWFYEIIVAWSDPRARAGRVWCVVFVLRMSAPMLRFLLLLADTPWPCSRRVVSLAATSVRSVRRLEVATVSDKASALIWNVLTREGPLTIYLFPARSRSSGG